MTTNLSDLYAPREISTSSATKTLRPWLLIGLGALCVAGVVAFTYVGRRDAGPPLKAAPAVAPIAVNGAPKHVVDPWDEQVGEPDKPTASDKGEEPTAVEALTAAKNAAEEPTGESPMDGKFYVQVAAYRNKADADAEAQALGEFGVQARTLAPTSASSWHKVRIGPFDTRVQAESARFKLDVSRRRTAYVLPRSNGKFHVQIGSFATREQAEPLAKHLEALGHSTKISRIRMAGQRWHCVRVGPFDTYDEAQGYQKLLPEIPGSESRVIPFAPVKQQ